jgi:hypothetical protein
MTSSFISSTGASASATSPSVIDARKYQIRNMSMNIIVLRKMLIPTRDAFWIVCQGLDAIVVDRVIIAHYF